MDITKLSPIQQQAIEHLFTVTAELPEVHVSQLRAGMYTNAQIVEKLPDIRVVSHLVVRTATQTPLTLSPEERRAVLSAEVDKWLKDTTRPLG